MVVPTEHRISEVHCVSSPRERRLKEPRDQVLTCNVDESQVPERWFSSSSRNDSDRHSAQYTASAKDGWGTARDGKCNRIYLLIRSVSNLKSSSCPPDKISGDPEPLTRAQSCLWTNTTTDNGKETRMSTNAKQNSLAVPRNTSNIGIGSVALQSQSPDDVVITLAIRSPLCKARKGGLKDTRYVTGVPWQPWVTISAP